MLSSGLWSANHATAILLMLNILFAPGIALYMGVKDKHGPIIFGQPPREWLRLIHEHPRPWRWATLSFVGAMLVTLFGLTLLACLLRTAGDPGFANVGLVAFAVGAVLWITHLAARLTVDPWAGEELATTGEIPGTYAPLRVWNGALFATFSYLTFAGVLLFGAAILATPLLPHWLGWITVIYSAGGLAIHTITRDSLPIMHHLMPFLIGVVLLLS